MIAFGPVPSRRLGRSLGINDIPPKIAHTAEKWVQPPSEEFISRSYHILHERIDHVEYLIGYEGNAFAFTGDVEKDLLSITSVHPMRKEAVGDFLARAGADWSIMESLTNRRQLIETRYKGRCFYMRKLRTRALSD